LRKEFSSPTWSPENDFTDSLESTIVTSGKTFAWDVNPSTRPVVQSRLVKLLEEEPTRSETFAGTPPPAGSVDREFVVTEADQEIMQVTLDWPTPDDLDLEVYLKNPDGSLTKVGSSGNFVGENEKVTINAPTPGAYVIRVINFASVTTTYTAVAALYDATEQMTAPLVEAYTLTCEKDGRGPPDGARRGRPRAAGQGRPAGVQPPLEPLTPEQGAPPPLGDNLCETTSRTAFTSCPRTSPEYDRRTSDHRRHVEKAEPDCVCIGRAWRSLQLRSSPGVAHSAGSELGRNQTHLDAV
jgi:hypothetical protein